MALRLNGSSSGYVELDVPAAAGSHTLTLPNSGGSSGQYLQTNGSGALSWAGAGKILQVVNATYATETPITITTFTDSGLSASITPSSSSNKILVLVSQVASAFRYDPFAIGKVRLVRGSTEIQDGRIESTCQNHSTFGNRITAMLSFSYLDSPATTSSVTYKTQGAPSVTANSGQVVFQYDGKLSTITLLEVEA